MVGMIVGIGYGGIIVVRENCSGEISRNAVGEACIVESVESEQ